MSKKAPKHDSEAPTPPAGVAIALPPPAEPARRAEDHAAGANLMRVALQLIAEGRLCGCMGDHDAEVYDCPKSIARTALAAMGAA